MLVDAGLAAALDTRHWFLIPDGSAISVEVFESVTCRLTRQVWTDQLREPPFGPGADLDLRCFPLGNTDTEGREPGLPRRFPVQAPRAVYAAAPALSALASIVNSDT